MDYIINQEEFICFSRPNGDIEKVLARLTKLPYSSIVERMQKHLGINHTLYDVSAKEAFANKIQEYYAFSQLVLPQLRDFKIRLGNVKDQKVAANSDFAWLFKTWPVYEEDCVLAFVDGKKEKLILS
jgi:hypothetical protein